MPSPAIDQLFLVGFMGTGKSTVGALLAARWGWPFVDLDAQVELASGMTIGELFAARGEVGFRKQEAEVLRQIAAGPKVVAVGGGAVCFHGNLEWMKQAGRVVCLRASPDEILQRVGDASSRPLLAQAGDKLAEVTRLLEVRRPFYEQADFTIDTDGVAPSQVAGRIEALLCP